MAKERHPVAFLVGAALGGVIGGLYGLRNAQRPGAETWARLTERWHDVEERTAEGIAQLDDEIRDRATLVQRQVVRSDTEAMIDASPRT